MIEGMWALLSGSDTDPDGMVNGGVIVLETLRVFGGDSAMAYVGDYQADNGKLSARVHSWTWNKAEAEAGAKNFFGMSGYIDHMVRFEGELGDGEIRGLIYSEAAPDQRLPAILKWMAPLPG